MEQKVNTEIPRYDCKKCRNYDPNEFCIGCEKEIIRNNRLMFYDILKNGTVFQFVEHAPRPWYFSRPKHANGMIVMFHAIHWEYIKQNYPRVHIRNVDSFWCDGTLDEARNPPRVRGEKYGDPCIYLLDKLKQNAVMCCGKECKRKVRRS